MDSTVIAAIIGAASAAILMCAANISALIYYVGRSTQRLDSHDDRLTKTETVADNAMLRATEVQARLNDFMH